MLEAERHRLILQLLKERSVLSISELAHTLGASETTVRRDINALADIGVLKRIRGGAESLRPRHEAHLVGVPFELNRGVYAEQKAAIASAAVELIRDGESILINGGTTTYAMVDYLIDRELDILTNSLAILTQLFSRSRNRLTVPGGSVYREQNIVLSPYERDATDHFWGQKLFTGCYGLNHFGLMEADPLIVQAERRLLERAEGLIVLADSRKFAQRSSMIVAPLSRISTLITDEGATEAQLEPFRHAGVSIIQVRIDAVQDDRPPVDVAL